VVAKVMRGLRDMEGHTFWPDDLSLVDTGSVDCERLLDSAQVTDSYLLALALAHGGKLATFDRRLVASAVADGAGSVHVID
jgi:predicted nucleic acid-binding protein